MGKLNPYLSMPGKCREVMTFYAACLDAKLTIQTVAESQVASELPEKYQDQVMHCVLENGEITIMASDMSKTSSVMGNNVQLCINCSSEEEINRYFSNLAAGGVVSDPLQKMFWGGLFGALTDRFGIHWMFNFESETK